MDVTIAPGPILGNIIAPPSKSAAHRALICSALAKEPTEMLLPESNADIEATIGCLNALCADILRKGDCLVVKPKIKRSARLLDCVESGSTLRFLLPLAWALGGAEFVGRGRLPSRPLMQLTEQMAAHGAVFSSPSLPFSVSGERRGGEFMLPGSVSSQFVSGLLLAAPLLETDVRITLSGTLESQAYVNMTTDMMARFGVQVSLTAEGYFVKGGQSYASPGRVSVEGDWSGAAFPLALGALSGRVTVRGLSQDSAQGDRAIAGLLLKMGAVISQSGGAVTAQKAPLHAIDVDVSGIPDLAPVLAAAMMFAQGESRLLNAARLRLKESDRLESTAAMVNALGGCAFIEGDSLLIKGVARPKGGWVEGRNDHRIVMAAAAAATRCRGQSIITDAQAIEKSYRAFFRDFAAMGGKANGV